MTDQTLHTELDDFLLQQAAEDAFKPGHERAMQLDLMRDLLVSEFGEGAGVDHLLGQYLGHIALYRGERKDNSGDTDSGTKVKVDFRKIGWLSDQAGEDKKEVEVTGQHVEVAGLEYDFVDLTVLDGVTAQCRKLIEATGEGDRLLNKVKTESIPMLWSDIMTGRGRQRPISVGTTREIHKASRAGRNLDTEYPGYKLQLHDYRAIILILGKNDQGDPQMGLAAIYEHDEQDKIWNELMTNKSGGD